MNFKYDSGLKNQREKQVPVYVCVCVDTQYVHTHTHLCKKTELVDLLNASTVCSGNTLYSGPATLPIASGSKSTNKLVDILRVFL